MSSSTSNHSPSLLFSNQCATSAEFTIATVCPSITAVQQAKLRQKKAKQWADLFSERIYLVKNSK